MNSRSVDKFPSITPDGKYIFFISDRPVQPEYSQSFDERKDLKEMKRLYDFYHHARSGQTYGDVYWVSTKIVDEMRPGG